jgi:Tfp pilus assembly protein PilN
MINLLSVERTDEIRAARMNVILVRYKLLIALALVFIGAALYVSYTVLDSTMASAEKRIQANDLKADVYKDTKQQVDELSAKLNESKTILDQEIRYSQALVKIGQLMPAGTVLGDLTLSTASFNGLPLEIKAYAKTTNEAGLLQNNFQSSGLFSNVTIKSTETSQEIDGYPVTIAMTVMLNKAGI